jgi:hypothetical protein
MEKDVPSIFSNFFSSGKLKTRFVVTSISLDHLESFGMQMVKLIKLLTFTWILKLECVIWYLYSDPLKTSISLSIIHDQARWFLSAEFVQFCIVNSSNFSSEFYIFLYFLWSIFIGSRKFLIILMFLVELCFILVVIGMVLGPQHLVIGSIYSCGAEGSSFFCM